ncbi:ataxin-2 [Tieghemostelium lacteum]|uniref:Ataxin-2 n=1 Tax=Tieghemostelium lacteum TaxID=361077 RepID=A0A151ZGE7_TIELA|nr:ataxin-2 [Tieghemostelium lacteum]|eukprot:KYQ93046.1 ataxin-2 [Tieghemostelium lacteum]
MNNQKKKPQQGGNQQQQKQQQQNLSGSGGSGHSKLQIQQQPQLSASQSQMKDRSTFIYMSLIGYYVNVTIKNGVVYEGVLHSVQPTVGGGIGIVLKMARKKETGTITTQPTPTIMIEAKDFVSLVATGVQLEQHSRINGSGSPHHHHMMKGDGTINTDTDISGFDGNLRERELQPWSSETHYDESLEGDSGRENGSDKKWDQFATNEKLFGVKTTFDEQLYTTHLDKASEFYKSNIHLAEKKANEIENDKSLNMHLLEERGHIQGNDYDEEERYSSVVRKGNPNPTTTSPTARVPLIPNTDKYIPPRERQRLLQQPSPTTTTPATNPTTTSPTTSNKPEQKSTTPQKQQPEQQQQTPTKESTTPSKEKDGGDQPQQPTTPNTMISGGTGTANVSKLILNRDKQPNDEPDHGVLGSPRDGLSPRFVEYMKVRQGLTDSKTKNLSGSDTPKSPLIQNRELLNSLSLEVVSGVNPDVVNDFNNFKLGKMNQSMDRQTNFENLKTFQRDYNIKSKSRPSSPSVSSPRVLPPPSHFSLSGSSKDDQKSDDASSTTTTTVATTTEQTTVQEASNQDTKKDIESKPSKSETTSTSKDTTTAQSSSATATTSGDKSTSATTPITSTSATPTNSSTGSLSKFKLNPNAKSFTPTVGGTKAPFKGSTDDLNKSTSNLQTTDTQTPINDVYYESMKKRQAIQEPSDSVPPYWVDPYGRQYEDDPYYHMRGIPSTMVTMPINAIPFYPNMPPGKGPTIITTKPLPYQPTPPRTYANGQNAFLSYVHQPQPPPGYQYVPQGIPVFNTSPPPPLIGGKRYFHPPPNSTQYSIPLIPNQPPPPQQPGTSPNRILTPPTIYPQPYGTITTTRYQPPHEVSPQHGYHPGNFQ